MIDLCVGLDFKSGTGVVAGVCGLGLDTGDRTRFVGEGSEPEPCSPSGSVRRVNDFFPFGFGPGLVFALGQESDLAGESERNLTFSVVPLLTGLSSTLSEVELPARASPPSS